MVVNWGLETSQLPSPSRGEGWLLKTLLYITIHCVWGDGLKPLVTSSYNALFLGYPEWVFLLLHQGGALGWTVNN